MDRNKNDYISFASVISAFAVVVLHTNGCFWNFSKTARYWKTANVIECVFYFAVPIFFMISGATLLDFFQRYDLREFLIKRIRKTVVPYIFWSLFGLGFQVYYLKNVDEGMVNGNYIINGLLSGGHVNIYWFFIPLFCAYLSIPLFAALAEELRKRVLCYIAIICFLLNCAVPFIISVCRIQIKYQFSIAVGSGYLLYLILGYLLHEYEVKDKVRYSIYALGIVGLLVHILGTYRLSMAAGEIVSTYKGYTNVPCILYSVAVFLFVKYAWGGKSISVCLANRIIYFLKDYTFGVYLIHWYIIQIVIREFDVNTQSIYYRLGAPFAIVAVAIALIKLIRKIPFGKSILP